MGLKVLFTNGTEASYTEADSWKTADEYAYLYKATEEGKATERKVLVAEVRNYNSIQRL